MIFQYHVRIPSQEHNHVNLLSFIWYADDIFIGQNLQQEHQYRNEMKKITDQLKNVHL